MARTHLTESLRCPRIFLESRTITTGEVLSGNWGGEAILAPDLPQAVMWLWAIDCTSGPQHPHRWRWCVRGVCVCEERCSLTSPPALLNGIVVKEQSITQASLFTPAMLLGFGISCSFYYQCWNTFDHSLRTFPKYHFIYFPWKSSSLYVLILHSRYWTSGQRDTAYLPGFGVFSLFPEASGVGETLPNLMHLLLIISGSTKYLNFSTRSLDSITASSHTAKVFLPSLSLWA